MKPRINTSTSAARGQPLHCYSYWLILFLCHTCNVKFIKSEHLILLTLDKERSWSVPSPFYLLASVSQSAKAVICSLPGTRKKITHSSVRCAVLLGLLL